MIGNCTDCRWWDADEEHMEGLTVRRCLVLSDRRPAATPPRLACLWPDAGADYADFMTEPNFGCVQFEVKVET